MIELKLWILTGIISFVVPGLLFFMNKWMRQQEKLTESVADLKAVTISLKASIEELKLWTSDRFVKESEFNRKNDELRHMISGFYDRLDTLHGIHPHNVNFPKT